MKSLDFQRVERERERRGEWRECVEGVSPPGLFE